MKSLIETTMDWVRSSIQPVENFPAATLAAEAASAAIVARVLRTGDGPAFLEVLARLSVLRPPLDPALSGPASHEFAQRRVGENGVFCALVHLLDVHDHLQRKDHAPENPDDPEVRAPFGWRDVPGLAGYGGEPDDAAAGNAGGIRFDEAGTVAVTGG